jgi:hypothetical protein
MWSFDLAMESPKIAGLRIAEDGNTIEDIKTLLSD